MMRPAPRSTPLYSSAASDVYKRQGMISKIARPKTILELGTYTGYSALCLAEGLQQDGVLHTIDINEELRDFQKKYFDLSNFKGQIHQHLGNALNIIPSLDIKFDLVFIDADKPNYPAYF